MNNKKWMLMTYYCPTHGDLGRIEPVELTREEISRNFLQKVKIDKNIIDQNSSLFNRND